MTETDDPKPEQPAEQAVEIEEDDDEGGWPSWLSWCLVIAAAVFGGFLLGHEGGGGGKSGTDSQILQQAQMKAELNRIKEQSTRRVDQYMHSFCREMIRVGLFRDGLDKNLEVFKGEIDKVVEELGKKDAKPEDRVAKATAGLKTAQGNLDKIIAFYSRQTLAMDKVGKIGTLDQHIAYFYVVRVHDLMAKAKTGDQRALKEAASCRERIAQMDQKLAVGLLQKYPQLAAKPRAPSTKPGVPSTKPEAAPAKVPGAKPAP